jgi:DNA repair exonuclease SbcCD ATPase subunit
MKLISVTIRNYRAHRELTVNFDSQRTLIGGPNESGKSTLVEAVHHALFLRARTTTTAIQHLRSDYHGGDPSVDLVFEAAAQRYSLSKTFTGKQNAPVRLACEGGDSLQGDEAEQKIHEICKLEAVAGRGIEERVRMQWAHLWVWQGSAGDNPFAAEGPGRNSIAPVDHLRDRLGAGAVLQSQRDTAVASKIKVEVDSRYKQKQTPKADSPLGKAVAELAAASNEYAAAEASLQAFDTAIRTIESAKETIAECGRELATIQQELAAVRVRRTESATLHRQLTEQSVAAKEATKAHDEFVAADIDIRRLEQEIAQLEATLAPARGARERAIAAADLAGTRLQDAGRTLRELGGTQAAVNARRDWLALCVRLEQAKVEYAGRRERCQRIRSAREDTLALQRQLGELPAVTDETLAALGVLEREHADAQASLRAIATRVELVAAESEVTLAGVPIVPAHPATITDDAELRVGDMATIRIRPGGGQGVAEAKLASDAAAASLTVSLASLGVADIAEARRVYAKRQSLAAELHSKTATIEGLGGSDTERKLEELEAMVAQFAAEAIRRTPEGETLPSSLAEADARHQEAEAEARLQSERAALANVELEAASAAQRAADTAKQRAADVLREAEGSLQVKQHSLDALRERHGEDRAGRIVKLASHRATAERVVATTQAAYDATHPGDIDSDEARLERAAEGSRTRRTGAITQKASAEGTLRFDGASDPRERRSKAVVRKRLAEARHAREDREGKAYQLLATLFENQQRAVEDQFVQPLAEGVTKYLVRLFGPGARATLNYKDGIFQDLALVRSDRGNVRQAFSQLSGGTREQVAAATRLAMAEILAEKHDGCLPIVFDDGFTNADPDRIRALQGVLDDAANRGLQVIVLSCTPNEYSTLGATRIDLQPLVFAGVAVGHASPSVQTAAEYQDEDDDTTHQAVRDIGPGMPSMNAAISSKPTMAGPVTDDQRTAFLAAVASKFGSAGNGALRTALGWDEATYDAVKKDLLAANRIAPGRGRGGSVRLRDNAMTSEP